MKRKSNLSEELYRMRKLMGYNPKKDIENITSYDRLIEEKLVNNYFINEQTKVTSKVYGTESGSYKRQELSNIMNNYDPNSGYLVIKDGNPWLAEQRAKSLASFLSTNVEKRVGVPFNKDKVKVLETSVSENTGDEYQYVEGTLYAIMSKPPIPEETFAYDLLYNFYEINGTPHIVVTKMGAGSPYKVTKDRYNKNPESFVNNVTKNASEAINDKGFAVYQAKAGGEGNIGILVPIPKNYAEKVGNRLYFKDKESLENMRSFIGKYTDGEDEFTKNPESNYLSSRWTSTIGGGGNYIFGREDGANAKIVSGSDKDKDIVIKRTYTKKSGEGKGAIKGTGEEGKWVKIGVFNLTKEEGAFADNMIKVQEGAYQKIFGELKTAVEKYRKEKLTFDEISATVKGYASADRATNRTNIENPDHDWGVGFPKEKWIKK
jgi:hypothetical protein